MRDERTLDELAELGLAHGIHGDVPYSQLEAEAVQRGVNLVTVVRKLLFRKLRRAGIL